MTKLPALMLRAHVLVAPLAVAAELDRSAVDFTPPGEIKWVRTVIQVWGMRPATSTPVGPR